MVFQEVVNILVSCFRVFQLCSRSVLAYSSFWCTPTLNFTSFRGLKNSFHGDSGEPTSMPRLFRMFTPMFQGYFRLAVPGRLFRAVPSCFAAVMSVPGCFGLIQTVLICIYIIYWQFKITPRCSGNSFPFRVLVFLFRISYSIPSFSVYRVTQLHSH